MTTDEQTIATPAIVVRRTAVGESDLVVALFTAELGRISAVARGAKRSRRRFAGGLEPLVVYEVEVRRRRGSELWSLEHADVIADHRALATDPIGVGHASYALELVRELAPPEAPEPALLDLVVELWTALAPGPSSSALRAFELTLVRLLGSAIALDQCAACGQVELDDRTLFDPARGGAVCAACAARSTGMGVRPLAVETRRFLHALGAMTVAEARACEAESVETRVAARDCMLSVVTHLVGHPLATLDYVMQVHGALRRS